MSVFHHNNIISLVCDGDLDSRLKGAVTIEEVERFYTKFGDDL